MQHLGGNIVKRGDRQNQAYGAMPPALFTGYHWDQPVDFLNQWNIPTVFEPAYTTVQDLDTHFQPNTDTSYSGAPVAPAPGFPPQQWQQSSLPSFDVAFDPNLSSTALYPASTVQGPDPWIPTQAFSESPFPAGPRESGQQLLSSLHERPRACLSGPGSSQDQVASSTSTSWVELPSSLDERSHASLSGPGSDQDQIEPSSTPASWVEKAIEYATRSPKSPPNLDRIYEQVSSGSVVTTGSEDIEPRRSSESVIVTGDHDTTLQPGHAQRKRSLPSTPDTREHKRQRRLDSPFSPKIRPKHSTNSLDSMLVGVKRLDVFSTDPFAWSVDFVLFALTSSQSIDLELGLPSSDASLPSCEELRNFILRHHIDGYNLLLCTDDIAMRHCGITEPGHLQALGEYIVHFRRRSPGYRSYCYEKQHPVNFIPERLINAAELNGVGEKALQDYMKSAKKAMKRVGIEEGVVHVLHYPIGSIEVSKGEAGQLKCSLFNVSS